MTGTGMRCVFHAGAAAFAFALAGCGSETPADKLPNGQAQAKPPAASAAPAVPQLRVELANGECQLTWNGTRVNGQGLLDAAVRELEGVIQRAGGPAGVTENLLTAAVTGTADTPWRCVGGAVHQLRRSGYARLELNFDGGPAKPLVVDLPIAVHAPPPPVEPAINRVAVGDDGATRWNGAAVQPDALLTYLRATQQMVPTPRLEVEMQGQTRLAAALAVLDVVRRAGVPIGPGAVEAPPPEAQIPQPDFGPPPPVVSDVPPPGDAFELVGLERFVPDLR